MMAILAFVILVVSVVILLWWLSERAHARAETAAMRQLRNAIEYLKSRKNR